MNISNNMIYVTLVTCRLQGNQKSRQEYNARAFKYIASEVKTLSGITPRIFFFSFIPWHGRAIAAVIIKTVRNRILHPLSPRVMPLKIEFGRVRYQLSLIWETGKKVFRKTA